MGSHIFWTSDAENHEQPILLLLVVQTFILSIPAFPFMLLLLRKFKLRSEDLKDNVLVKWLMGSQMEMTSMPT